jgi:CheY-like chemotaxis protein
LWCNIAVLSPGSSNMTKHILIADDDILFRELLIARLEGTGLVYDTASDGAEALAKATQGAYDLLLLDLRMPKLDGLRVLEGVRSSPRVRNTKVIVLTASRSDADIDEAERLGVDSYLSKPVDIERLFDRICMVLDPDSAEARKTWLVEDYSEEDFVLRS